MSEGFPVKREQDPSTSWWELEGALAGDLEEYAGLSYAEFMDIDDEGARIGVLYTLEAFGSSMTFDEIEQMLFDKGILEKYL